MHTHSDTLTFSQDSTTLSPVLVTSSRSFCYSEALAPCWRLPSPDSVHNLPQTCQTFSTTTKSRLVPPTRHTHYQLVDLFGTIFSFKHVSITERRYISFRVSPTLPQLPSLSHFGARILRNQPSSRPQLNLIL
jgi:hypothetical protein